MSKKLYISKADEWYDENSVVKLIDDYRPGINSGLFEGVRTCVNPLAEGNVKRGEKRIDQEVCLFDEFDEVIESPIVAFTMSSWDIIHCGYIEMLKDMKSLCDHIIVGLNKNPHYNNSNKNEPIHTFKERKLVLESIRYIDEIIPYENDEKLPELFDYLKDGRVHFRVLGSDWLSRYDEIIGSDIFPLYFHPRYHDYSVSNLRRKIYETELQKESDKFKKELEKLPDVSLMKGPDSKESENEWTNRKIYNPKKGNKIW